MLAVTVFGVTVIILYSAVSYITDMAQCPMEYHSPKHITAKIFPISKNTVCYTYFPIKKIIEKNAVCIVQLHFAHILPVCVSDTCKVPDRPWPFHPNIPAFGTVIV